MRIHLPPAHKVPGTLRFDPDDGVSLELLDTSRAPDEILAGASSSLPIVVGNLRGGQPITLLDCIPSTTHLGGAGFAEVNFVANHLLVGIGLRSPTDSVFQEIRIALTSLDEWFATPPLRCEVTGKSKPATGRKITVEGEHVPGFGFSPLHGGPSILSDQNLYLRGNDLTERVVGSRFGLRIIPRSALSVDACVEELFRLQVFLSMLFGHQPYFRQIRLLPDKSSKHFIHYFAQFSRPPSNRRAPKSEDILLPLPSVVDALPTIWTNWTQRSKEYQSAVELYSACQLHHGQMTNFELLAIMQALETLHRSRFGGTYMDPSEYSIVCSAMCDTLPRMIPPDLRSSLMARLRYGNEFALRRRLKAIAGGIPEAARTLLHSRLHEFLERAIKTRNYFTHFDEAGKRDALQGTDLYWGTRLLRWIFLAFMLSDLGLPEAVLLEALSRSEQLGHVRTRLASISL